MAFITIYKSGGGEVATVEHGDENFVFSQLMGDTYAELTFSLPTNLTIPLMSYIDVGGERLYLYQPPNVDKIAQRNFSFKAYFRAKSFRTKGVVMRDTATGRTKWPLTTTPRGHITALVDALNAADGDSSWVVDYANTMGMERVSDGPYVDIDGYRYKDYGKEKVVSFENITCAEALNEMATVFDTEYEIREVTHAGNRLCAVSLHRVEYNKAAPLEVRYGQGYGLLSGVQRTNSGELPTATTLFVVGGDQNIPPNYYGSDVNGRQLRLPKGDGTGGRVACLVADGTYFFIKAPVIATDAHGDEYIADSASNPTPIYDDGGSLVPSSQRPRAAECYLASGDGLSLKRVRHTTFDNFYQYPEAKCEKVIESTEIYPARVGVVGNVVEHVEQKTDEEGVVTTFYLYDIQDNDPSCPDFSDCSIPDEAMTVIFQDGDLAGREFDVNTTESGEVIFTNRTFELCPAEDGGVTLPSPAIKPKRGDKYVVFHCALPYEYISGIAYGAEYNLLRLAASELSNIGAVPYEARVATDPIFAKENWDDVGSFYAVGQHIKLTDSELFGANGQVMRVTSVKRKISNQYSNDLTLSTVRKVLRYDWLSHVSAAVEGSQQRRGLVRPDPVVYPNYRPGQRPLTDDPQEADWRKRSFVGSTAFNNLQTVVVEQGGAIDEHSEAIEEVGGRVDALDTSVTAIKAGIAPIGGDKTVWNFITEHENKLETIEEGAQVNVQPDWTATTGDGVILHKPTLGTASALNTGTSAGSVPVLGEGGKLSSSMLPAIAVTDTFVVDTLTEMYNLDVTHPGELEQGDVCVVRNEKKTFILKEKGTATTSHWVEFLAPGGDISGCELVANKVNSWSTTTTNQHYPSEKLVKDSLDGKASATHTHTASNITDFNSAAREQAKNVCLRTDGGNKMKSTISFDANTTVPLDTTSATKVIVETNSNSLAYKNINDFATSSSVTTLAVRVTTIEGKESGWDAKYSKPSTGIPSSDLASGVQTILSNASTDHTNLGGHTVGKNVPSNAVFTDTHYTNYFLIKADDTQVAKFTQDADVTLNLKADSNVNFDIVGSTIYISATDTTYQSKSASSGSSEVSLVTRGEKYTWNSKGTVTGIKMNGTVKGTSGVVDLGTVLTSVTKSDIGLGNVDNTSDLNKPVSTATQTALNGKANATHTHTATSDIKTATASLGTLYMADGSGNLQQLNPGSNGQYLQMANGRPNWGAEPVTYYTVTLTTNVAECPVTGGGQYQKNSTATIQAFPRDPYVFQKWSDNNTSNPRTVTVTSNITLQAIFAKVTYSVTLSCDTTKGSVSGGGSAFDKGSSVTITATPKSGYQFVRWSDNNTSNPRTLTMTQNYTLTAIFAGQTFTVFVESDDEDKGGATGGGSYSKNETCTLLAEPKEGYAFDHWVFDGDNLPMESEENPYIFIVESNVNVVVFFRALSVFNVFAAVTPSGGGSVSGDGDYNEGETATLIATANSGYAFDYWHDEGTGVDYETATLTFAVTGNRTLTAHFVQSVVIHTVTLGVSPSGSGTVTGGGTYTHGSSATITATANSGYAFVKWSDNNTQSTRTFTVNSDVTLTAIFEAVTGYVTDGLVFRLDGLEMGSDANAWTDLVNGYKFTGNAQRGIDGYTFNGTNQYLKGDANSPKYLSQTIGTIEIVCSCSKVHDGSMTIFTALQSSSNINHWVSFELYNNKQTYQWSRAYDSSNSHFLNDADNNVRTIAILKTSGSTPQRSFKNKVETNPLYSDSRFGSHNGDKWMIGCRMWNGVNALFFTGTIKAIRIYNRVLTDAEILANQQLDMERFNIS